MVVANRAGRALECPSGIPQVTITLPQSTSLSQARNACLAEARKLGLLEGTIVNFPDDDSWFPQDFAFVPLVSLGVTVDVIIGCYGPESGRFDQKRFPTVVRPLTPKVAVRVANSVGMFWTAEALCGVGNFDEGLGVGSAGGSSEDLDMLLRALASNKSVVYDGTVRIYHPYVPSRPAQYYRGNLLALKKNLRVAGVRWLFLRRLGGGACMVFRRELPADVYIRSMTACLVTRKSRRGS